MSARVIQGRSVRVQARPRWRQIDALRGLAALSVVAFHLASPLLGAPRQPGDMNAVLELGRLGVLLFFVISGLVIQRSVESSPDARSFAIARFARLFPTFWVFVLLTGAILLAGDWNPLGVAPGDLGPNLTMAPGFLRARPIDPSYWTLQCELFFYMLIGAAFLVVRIRRVPLFCLCWLVATVALRHGVPAPDKIGILLNAEYACLFVAGMMLNEQMKPGRSLSAWAVLALAVATAYLQLPLPEAIAGTLSVLLVWLGLQGALRPLNAAVFGFFGAISYSLYLCHQVIGHYALSQLAALGAPEPIGLAITFAALVALAWIARRMIEVPVDRLIRSRLLGSRGAPLPAPAFACPDR